MPLHHSPVDINVPDGSRVSNYLYRDMTPDELSQDLLTVVLPNGVMIEVGWFPENDPSGSFHIVAALGALEIQSWTLRSLDDVILLVQRQADRFSKRMVSIPQSSTSKFVEVSV